jgi:exodeoxyribonuclease V alpha subunit
MRAGPGIHHDPSVLEGALERITYANPQTGYAIARSDPGRPDLVTAVGPLLGAQVGESLRMRGSWASHPKYDKQFEVLLYITVPPATVQGIQRGLGSGPRLPEPASPARRFVRPRHASRLLPRVAGRR